jgi:hypothetical protein
MRFNIFSGARRIAAVLGVLWVAGWIADAIFEEPQEQSIAAADTSSTFDLSTARPVYPQPSEAQAPATGQSVASSPPQKFVPRPGAAIVHPGHQVSPADFFGHTPASRTEPPEQG